MDASTLPHWNSHHNSSFRGSLHAICLDVRTTSCHVHKSERSNLFSARVAEVQEMVLRGSPALPPLRSWILMTFNMRDMTEK